MKNSDKLLILIARSNMTKTKAAKKLGISRPTLDKKIKDNDISENELLIIERN